MTRDVSSVMRIPSERGGIVVGKNGATLTKTQQDTQTAIVLEKDDSSAITRITITGRDKRKVLDAERRILEQLSSTQKESEWISSAVITKLVESWNIEESINFSKTTQTFVEIAKTSIIKGWDKKSFASASSLLTKKAGKITSDISNQQENRPQGRMGAVVEVPTDALASKSDKRALLQLESDCSVSIMRTTGNNGKKRKKTTFNITANNTFEQLNDCMSKLTLLLEPLPVTIRSSGSASSAHTSSNKKKEKLVPIPDHESESDTDSESLMTTENDKPERDTEHIKYPKCMNVLVLGETGVGKSTFINGLVNYLKYGSMDEALEGGVAILIKSHFTLTDDNFETKDIVTEVTIPDEQGAATNEMHGQGQSATQDPTSYMLGWVDNGELKTIRIIDTPGIGDTRGVDQDKKNFDKILSFIADFSELHTVCILIKPNTVRPTHQGAGSIQTAELSPEIESNPIVRRILILSGCTSMSELYRRRLALAENRLVRTDEAYSVRGCFMIVYYALCGCSARPDLGRFSSAMNCVGVLVLLMGNGFILFFSTYFYWRETRTPPETALLFVLFRTTVGLFSIGREVAFGNNGNSLRRIDSSFLSHIFLAFRIVLWVYPAIGGETVYFSIYGFLVAVCGAAGTFQFLISMLW